MRGLRERALLAKLGPKTGFVGRIRSVGARGRIIDALDARSRGEKGELDEDDAKTLDEYLADVPEPSAEELKSLGDARLAVVQKALQEEYGIAANQIATSAAPADKPVEGDPGVAVELGSAR